MGWILANGATERMHSYFGTCERCGPLVPGAACRSPGQQAARPSCLSSTAALHRLFAALADLLHRELLDVRGEVPDVAERVLERAAAVAIELVLERLLHGGARLDGAREGLVHVLHVDV